MPEALSAAALRVSMECGGLWEHTELAKVLFPAASTTFIRTDARFIPSILFENDAAFTVQSKANWTIKVRLTWGRPQLQRQFWG